MDKKQKLGKNKNRKLEKEKLLLIFLAIVVIIVTVGVIASSGLFSKDEPHAVVTVSKSSLEKIIEKNELSTLECAYNAVVKVKTDNGKDYKYYVAYEGTIKTGINFSEINIELIENQKKVVITLPEVKILDTSVRLETMDYIFEKEKYETETISQEAYKICTEDLKKRAENDVKLKDMARSNAIASVEALVEPWINQVDEQYIVEIN